MKFLTHFEEGLTWDSFFISLFIRDFSAQEFQDMVTIDVAKK